MTGIFSGIVKKKQGKKRPNYSRISKWEIREKKETIHTEYSFQKLIRYDGKEIRR